MIATADIIGTNITMLATDGPKGLIKIMTDLGVKTAGITNLRVLQGDEEEMSHVQD